MNAPSAAGPLLRLGERLSRTPRRLAAAAALLAVLATGGLGVLLASSQPAARTGADRGAAWAVPSPSQTQRDDDWDDDWDEWPWRQRPPASARR